MIDSTKANVLIQLTPGQLEEFVQHTVEETLRRKGEHSSNDDLDDWLTREETAKMLHVSFPTLRQYEKEKLLVPCRIKRRVLYSRKEVEEKLRQGFVINRRRKG